MLAPVSPYTRRLALLAALVIVSCSPRATESNQSASSFRPMNVLLVTVDTLRADRLHCYGNNNIETPTFDALAARGAQFMNAVTQVPLTTPSHASIFTGTNPNVHQVRNTGGFVLKSSAQTIATILSARGWNTAAFVSASVLKRAFGFANGFAVYDDLMPSSSQAGEESEASEIRAGEVVNRIDEWIAKASDQPFFLWAHFYDPHEPYDPPEPFHSKYRANLYDGEIAYVDQQLGRLLDIVSKNSHGKQTLIVVLSDHGESLGDHGEFNHGVFLYDSTLRVPLLMAGPGVPVTKVSLQARTIDILPTIVDLLAGDRPAGIQGVSLVPALSGKAVATTYSYEETLYPKMNMGWAELRGVRTEKWKYIHAPKPELYDLASDPNEKNNVISAHPNEAQELETKLRAMSRVAAGSSESVTETQMDSRTLAQLKSLGYLSGAAGGDIHLDGTGADPKDRIGTLLAFQKALGPESRNLPEARKITFLKQALANDESNPSLYFYLTAEYEKAGRYDQAMATCQAAEKRGIANGRLLSRMGDLYLRVGNKEAAIAAFEKAAQHNPFDYESETNLGTAYLEKQDLPNAERCFRWALTVEDFAPAENGLGLVAIQRQDSANAKQYFERASALDPTLVEAQLNLGLLYKMAGDIPRSREHFSAFLAHASAAKYSKIIPQVKQELAALH